MAFDFRTLEPLIHQVLAAPGTDLTTISAKRVRRQLLTLDLSLTAEFLKENKDDVDAVIAGVFEMVSVARGIRGSQDGEEPTGSDDAGSRKRKQGDDESEGAGGEEQEEEEDALPPKKAKKVGKGSRELSDAELARKLSTEINGRSRRSYGAKPRGAGNPPKRALREKKSAAMVDSDDDSGVEREGVKKAKPKRKATTAGGGTAKGGFAKEYVLRYPERCLRPHLALMKFFPPFSEPLAAVLQVDKLSRPQVVKQLWVYIKGNELQNPENKKEILCDVNLKAVFGVDKIGMFKMNKVLGS